MSYLQRAECGCDNREKSDTGDIRMYVKPLTEVGKLKPPQMGEFIPPFILALWIANLKMKSKSFTLQVQK